MSRIESKTRCIGILTAGGDCPGLNAAIRGVVKPAISHYGIEVIGILDGYRGLLENHHRLLTEQDVSGILTRGGTILGSSRDKPFKIRRSATRDIEDLSDVVVENYKRLHLDCLVCLGGNGTHKTAYKLSKKGINVIGLPKTIDNDVAETELTFGYDSAAAVAAESIDRLHTTAEAHNRVMIIEIMGHHVGWLALQAGLAGGADVILIPEIPYNIDKVAEAIIQRTRIGKWFSIVAVAEGAVSTDEFKKVRKLALEKTRQKRKNKGASDNGGKKGKKSKKKSDASDDQDELFENTLIKTSYDEVDPAAPSAGERVAQALRTHTGMDVRVTVLGYLQRGGEPTPFDRALCTRFGTEAARLLAEGKYNRMVAMRNGIITSVPLKDVAGRIKTVPTDDGLLESARMVGTEFGD